MSPAAARRTVLGSDRVVKARSALIALPSVDVTETRA